MKYQTIGRRGFSVTELMMSLGIVTIITLAFMSAFSDQYKELRAMEGKVRIQEIARNLQSQMTNESYCNCLLRGRTFDTTQPASTWDLPLGAIPNYYNNPPPAAPTPCVGVGVLVPSSGNPIPNTSINIESVKLNEVNDHGSGNYTGSIEVQFNSSNQTRALRPIKVPVKLTLDLDANTPTNRPFMSCKSSLPAGPVPLAFEKSVKRSVTCSGGATGTGCATTFFGGTWEQCFITANKVTFGNAGTYSHCYTILPPGLSQWNLGILVGPNATVYCEAVCVRKGTL